MRTCLAAPQFLEVLLSETGRVHMDVKDSQFFDEAEESDSPIQALDLGFLPLADAGLLAGLSLLTQLSQSVPHSWTDCSASAGRTPGV